MTCTTWKIVVGELQGHMIVWENQMVHDPLHPWTKFQLNWTSFARSLSMRRPSQSKDNI
jgi:hypothetical protein